MSLSFTQSLERKAFQCVIKSLGTVPSSPHVQPHPHLGLTLDLGSCKLSDLRRAAELFELLNDNTSHFKGFLCRLFKSTHINYLELCLLQSKLPSIAIIIELKIL